MTVTSRPRRSLQRGPLGAGALKPDRRDRTRETCPAPLDRQASRVTLMTENSPTPARPLLLLVDDEAAILKILERFGTQVGYDVVTCANGAEAMRVLARRPADLAMVDLRMPDMNGLDLLRQIRASVPGCEVILMTGFAAVDSAVEAIKLGAREYLTKPFDFDRLRQVLVDTREELERRAQILVLEGAVARQVEFCGMLGRSPAMQEVFSLIRRLAPHAKVVLVSGETGTGKELAARAFHQMGPRRAKPFLTVNCSAVVDTLFESELFGHVRGAFTGATESKVGLFEAASGGTLFLDEIGELPQGCRPSSSVPSSAARCSESEPCSPDRWTSSSLPPRIAICARTWRADGFARICSTA